MTPTTVWQHFDWFRGTCFRCDTTGIPVAHVGDVTSYGKPMPLYACHLCIFRLQQRHWIETGRQAWPLHLLQLPPSTRNRAHRPTWCSWLRYRKRSEGRHRCDASR